MMLFFFFFFFFFFEKSEAVFKHVSFKKGWIDVEA